MAEEALNLTLLLACGCARTTLAPLNLSFLLRLVTIRDTISDNHARKRSVFMSSEDGHTPDRRNPDAIASSRWVKPRSGVKRAACRHRQRSWVVTQRQLSVLETSGDSSGVANIDNKQVVDRDNQQYDALGPLVAPAPLPLCSGPWPKGCAVGVRLTPVFLFNRPTAEAHPPTIFSYQAKEHGTRASDDGPTRLGGCDNVRGLTCPAALLQRKVFN
ncbi:hypothetical protein EVAR_35555_1 [Eumeta japonica]|uniref:Uncharacterized protein n=1 Tax=Eumeta variegata TaxID=151549 RepID=A0A4C1XJR1_EUMVA|nr:hypothetical protein EVAR_35555_1 [Eumeta japonica]